MKKYTSILIVALVLFTGCEVLDNEQKEVNAEISEESFSIYNGTNKTIWFDAFKTDDLPFINYALSSGDGNKVEIGKVGDYSGEELIGAFNKGDNITVFYWSVQEPKDDDINFIRVNVK